MSERDSGIWWIIGGAAALILLAAGGTFAVYAWEESAEGKKWAPVLAAAEAANGLPAGLLSRQAAEESSFDPAVIYGTETSSAGALGILQLEPAYFSSVNVPTPFTDADVTAQINQAAAEDARLYGVFGSWPLAMAAYNWGQGNVSAWVASGADSTAWPPETQKYVADITSAVPALAQA
jgi:membrane-bound lytic murein transglycosylase D